MRMIRLIFAIATLTVFAPFVSCAQTLPSGEGKILLITTDMGDIQVLLYDETPLHRDNIVRLASEGFYDGILFHRVIKNFMIQGGDPESKNAEPGARLGSGGPGHTIPAEIVPGKFHKKGAIASARLSDQINPERNSSGSQFYLVQGKVWRPGELDTMELQRNSALLQAIFREFAEAAQAELDGYRVNNDEAAFNIRVAEIREAAEAAFESSPQKFQFSDEQREAYTTIGGYPSLDNAYTVFGEVIEGWEVIDRIAASETDPADRPLVDIKMKIKVLR